MATIRQLVFDSNALIRDLAQGILPGVSWTEERTRIARCPSGQGRRATVVFRLNTRLLGIPTHQSAMIDAARTWTRKHRFSIILDEQRGNAQLLVASNKLLAFNIKANSVEIRIKASTCCARA